MPVNGEVNLLGKSVDESKTNVSAKSNSTGTSRKRSKVTLETKSD